MVQGVEVEKRKGNIKKPSVIPRPVLTLVVGIRIPFAEHKNMLPPQGRTDCHVAALLATAAYHDSLNSRLVPLGAMTVVFCTLPCLLSIGNSPKSGDPSVTADAVPASRCGSVTARL